VASLRGDGVLPRRQKNVRITSSDVDSENKGKQD
jgi:hypothetical protein